MTALGGSSWWRPAASVNVVGRWRPPGRRKRSQ
jgi:hypothetical protein